MEFKFFRKRGLPSFFVLFVLVVSVEARSFSYIHGLSDNVTRSVRDQVTLSDDNEKTIEDAIAREVVKETVTKNWESLKKKGVFTETGKSPKEVTFLASRKISLAEVFQYLRFYPLLEKGSVIYTIPVDGEEIKLQLKYVRKLRGKFDTFTAKYLYPDPTDPTGKAMLQTDLHKPNYLMQELVANTNEHPELRSALELAMPKIFDQKLAKTGTFQNEFDSNIEETETNTGVKPSIPDDIKNKAFRNAIEAMASTSILSKKTETWIAQVNNNVQKTVPISIKEEVKKQWKDWKTKGVFTETPATATDSKKVKFNTPLKASPNEIFRNLQHFTHLESTPVIYFIPIDGRTFEIKLAPDPSGGFTANELFPDPSDKSRRLETDLSQTTFLMEELRSVVSEHPELELAAGLSFTEIFKYPWKKNDLFKDALAAELAKTGKTIPGEVRRRVFKQAVELVVASTLFKKSVPKSHWMSSVTEDNRKDIEKLNEQMKAKAVKKKWKDMKSNGVFTETTGYPKIVTFPNDADVKVKDIFSYLRYFRSLESGAVTYKIPVDGQNIELRLQTNSKGKLTANYIYEEAGLPKESDLSKTQDIIHELMGDTQTSTELRRALEESLPKIFDQKLDEKGTFKDHLESRIAATKTKTGNAPVIPDGTRKKAFRQSIEAMASAMILGKEPVTWIDKVDEKMGKKRSELEDRTNKQIKRKKENKLRIELAASMLGNTKEAQAKWKRLVQYKFIKETFDSRNKVKKIEIVENAPLTIKETFKLLQHFNQIYPSQGQTQAEVKIPIGLKDRTFYISKARQGEEQIQILGKDKHWPGTTDSKPGKPKPGKRPKVITPATIILTSYEEIMDRGLRDFPEPKRLAEIMLRSINSKLNKQPNFNKKLEIKDPATNKKEKTKTLDAIRSTVEFMIITMVAEAAHVPEYVETTFNTKLAESIKNKREFPSKIDMPSLENLGKVPGTTRNIKAGRSPTADEVVIKLLKKIKETGRRFDSVFKSTDDHFPFMRAPGGTKAGREYLHAHGDDDIPSTLIRKRANSDHDGETIAKRARMSCAGPNKRKKRQACSLEEINNDMIVDEKSIKVKETKIELDVVDRRDATKRKHLEINLSPDELATPKLVQEKFAESERPHVSQRYAKINKGLAVHGLIFSALGAIDYFQRGDDVRGGIAVSQSLHTLGGLTGFNEIASKAAKQALRYSAFKISKGFNMERGLETFSSKVGKFMEKGVGKLMGDLPGVGLAFDIYFIEQDVEALANLDLNNPEDLKILPLRVVDLVLDVDTTVLNLIGTFCPGAVVITEPLVIVLSIVRMAIDDFYIDIMEEMEKVNWKSPWAGFEFIGALFKGIIEGAADFLSGGLRRQMENYSQQEKADNKLLTSLTDATSYYKITGKKGAKKIDFAEGELSSFAGFITFRMLEGGWVHLQIGDVRGEHDTIDKKIHIGDDVTDVVLGIGESREFLYEEKTAKMWFFIPIHHYRIIKGAKLKSQSLHGTYYGNSRDNKFYAVQNQKEKSEDDQRQKDSGKINVNFVTGHYHYNLYGRGGDDLFYLGPQMSHVTGGQGSDVYIVQSYGGNTIIDNFSEDNKRDMVIINVPYSDISCGKSDIDLDILYRNTHHVRITNWFAPGNPNYYRHISFRSLDGIIFVAKDAGSEVKCTAIAITKGSQKSGENIRTNVPKYSEVKQIVGTDFEDSIYGNDLNNILDGGKGADVLEGGRSEDTYIIRANEGCDTINNNADDYEKTTDVAIFEIPYDNIALEKEGDNLKVFENTNEQTKRSSCFTIQNWLQGEQYRHMIFSSSDHVVFKIKTEDNKQEKLPMVLDYSSSTKGVKVDLAGDLNVEGFIHHTGFDQVATVSDSKYNDVINGNTQSNFLSCSGGEDLLSGGNGSDNYVVKRTCQKATIKNYDANEKVDLLLLDYNFEEITGAKYSFNFSINHDSRQVVILFNWYGSSSWQHIWIRTKDGITLRVNGDQQTLDPVEISKDPVECQCKGPNCETSVIRYDLGKHPWTKVTRFQLKSSYCSYHIKGNPFNNYIDPGSGNGYSFQYFEGKDGADTYVLKHGYGEFNIINNYAKDKKMDILKIGLELKDIHFSFYKRYDVILSSKSRPSSLTVKIKKYFKSPEYQHLQVLTSDQVTFEIQKEHPFMKIISLDLSLLDSPQKVSSKEMRLASKAQVVRGVQDHPNVIQGTSSTKEIDGGSKEDNISGGPGNDIIDGKQGSDELSGKSGDDIIFGGDGDDVIKGDDGNDYIYGGDGKDVIDGGSGGDTIAFKGDGFNKKGVYVDLSGGFGLDADAEGDTYNSIEHVYGTIHSDIIIGSDSSNNLYGQSGNDVIIAKGGNDQLVGGEGSDRYILDHAYGIKVIDNFALYKQKDTLSLSRINSKDICVFLVDKDLYLQVQQPSFEQLLYQNTNLTVVVSNWGTDDRFRHLSILFKNTYWPSHAMEEIRHTYQFKQMGPIVQQITKKSNFRFLPGSPSEAVRLSWTPIAILPLDDKAHLSLLQVDMENSKHITITEIVGDAMNRGQLLLPSLQRNKHYIFALFIKYCSAKIAISHSLIYFGEKRECQAMTIANSKVIYRPKGSLLHGTKARVRCLRGYKLTAGQPPHNETCLDGNWQPPLPTCVPMATCPALTHPINGRVKSKTIHEGSLGRYVCERGFRLIGLRQRHCMGDGTWEGKKPECRRLNCLQLPKVKHGEIINDPGNKKNRGTLEHPRHGMRVQLQCDQYYVEQYKVDKLFNPSRSETNQQRKIENLFVCRAGRWKGNGEMSCLPFMQIFPKRSDWVADWGHLQQWDDSDLEWKISLDDDQEKHQLACSNLIDGYSQKTRSYLIEDGKILVVVCPRIRFGDKITDYEGKLQVLVKKKWVPACLLESRGNEEHMKNLQGMYEILCQEMGIEYNKPGIAQIDNGPTSYDIKCSPDTNKV